MTEDRLTPEEIAWLQAWTLKVSSIAIRDDQEYLLHTRLSAVARHAGIAPSQLVQQLRKGDRALEIACIDALTTNETSWFRDVKPFNVLSSTIIPNRLEANRVSRELSIWSAASSAGQELYSIAMLLDDQFPELGRDWKVRLTGTDISQKMVAKAASGRYTQLEVDRGLPAKHLVRYLERDGIDWVVKPNVKKLCQFTRHNLSQDVPPGQFDVVLCRYVLIYFDEPTRAEVVRRITTALKPGGVLLLGASEIGGRHVAHLEHEVVDRVSFFRKPVS